MDENILEEASNLFVKSGNALREFALLCVESSKKLERFNPENIANKLIEASQYEEKAALLLKKIV